MDLHVLPILNPHPIPLGHPRVTALSACLMHPTWAGDRQIFLDMISKTL